MTPKQYDLMLFIEQFIDEHGYSPSFQEMMDGTGLTSKSHVFSLLTGLERLGRIRRLPKRVRAIEVVEQPSIPIPNLSHVPTRDLVSEIKRRHFVVCHAMRDEYGDRTFHEVTPDLDLVK